MTIFSVERNVIWLFLAISLVGTAVAFDSLTNAFGITGPIVIPAPASGTYRAVQSGTLIASTPSTIYYTTDGTTPTTSSTNSPSPVTGIIINNNSTLKFFATDSFGNVGQLSSASYQILIPTLIQMNDPIASAGLSTYKDRQIHAEYVSGTSSLVGKKIDAISVQLKKVGSPTGTATIGVFRDDLSVKQSFGAIDIGTNQISTSSYKNYAFSLPAESQPYQIQAGDRIGIKFSGGDSSKYVAIMTDRNGAFDGANSYHSHYTTSWASSQGEDLYMSLSLHLYGTGPTVSASALSGMYNSTQSVTILASAPSTIYYTTDGTTPTTSSTNGPNPVTGIIINNNSTLKFFAKDTLGNISPTVTQVYTIIPPPHYDGKKAVISINFEHALASQWSQINSNMSGMNASVAVIVQRMGHTGYMTAGQLHTLEKRGFEIVSHSETHLFITPDTPTSAICYEAVQSKIDLQKMGFKVYGMVPPYINVIPQNFATIVPTYSYTELLQTSLGQVNYNITYNTPQSINGSKQALGIYDVPTMGVGTGDQIQNFTSAKSIIDNAIAKKLWVDIHFHGINYAGGQWDTTPEFFTQIMSYLKQQKDAGNLLVLTHAQALNLVGRTNTTTVVPPNSTCAGLVNTAPPPPPTPMNDKTATFGLSVYSGRQIQAEYINSNSTLVNETINSITVTLKQANPSTGPVYVGVFNPDLSIKRLFGTIDASTIKTSYTSYTVTMSGVETRPYVIQKGDYIGIKYDGASPNQLAIMMDQSGTFDGGDSYLSYYDIKWRPYLKQDLTMTLSLIQ